MLDNEISIKRVSYSSLNIVTYWLTALAIQQLNYECFPPPAYLPPNEELQISTNINPCKPQQTWNKDVNGFVM